MNVRISYSGFCVLTFLLMTGCATISAGSTQVISVSSNVAGAQIYLDGLEIGTTPFTGEIAKNRDALLIKAEGYQTQTVVLSSTLAPDFWGNIISGGTIGSITDLDTGAAYQYAPASYHVELQAAGQATADYQQRYTVRKFSIIYIDEISRNLSQGGGDYLSALVGLLEGYHGQEIDAVAIRNALAISRGDRIHFGNLVADLH